MTEVLRAVLQPRWSDTDQYHHMNNVALLSLVEEARVRTLGFPEKPEHFPVGLTPALAVLGPDTFTMVVGQRVEYLAEMPYAGQNVHAEVWFSRVGGRSVTMECRIADECGETVYLIARVSIVIMDTATRRPRQLTDTETEHLTGFLAEPLAFRD
jgi:acyl-CoA thioester hydrolase